MTQPAGPGWPWASSASDGPAPDSSGSPPPLPTSPAADGPFSSAGAPDGTWPAPPPGGQQDRSAAPAPSGPTPPDDPAVRPRRRVGASMFLAFASVALIAGLIGGAGGAWLLGRSDERLGSSTPVRPGQVTVSAGAEAPPIARAPESIAGIAATVLPSVVQIEVAVEEGEGSGSGFILDSQGHILTNSHVVAQAVSGGDITIVFDDGSKQEAQIIGRDAAYDLAVLRTEVGSRRPLQLGDSDRVVVGDPVIAIGAPLGLQGTVTTGIVSATNRPVSAGVQNRNDPATYINAIQTDAAINPGNSGGPLVDANGRVIGINSAIAQASANPFGAGGGNIGVGFAIPSNQARRTAEALITRGAAEYPVIGVSLTSDYQGEGVKVAEQSLQGQAAITPGGPADQAGIEPGDVIVALDGKPMTTALELIVGIRARAVGDTVVLTVRRDGQDRDITVTLQAAPS